MTYETFQSFRQRALDAGFDEVLERQWPANTVIDAHTHAFDVDAVVMQGDLWLGCAGDTRHLKAGDTFTLARNTEHTERYGPEGATYWVARRNPP